MDTGWVLPNKTNPVTYNGRIDGFGIKEKYSKKKNDDDIRQTDTIINSDSWYYASLRPHAIGFKTYILHECDSTVALNLSTNNLFNVLCCIHSQFFVVNIKQIHETNKTEHEYQDFLINPFVCNSTQNFIFHSWKVWNCILLQSSVTNLCWCSELKLVVVKSNNINDTSQRSLAWTTLLGGMPMSSHKAVMSYRIGPRLSKTTATLFPERGPTHICWNKIHPNQINHSLLLILKPHFGSLINRLLFHSILSSSYLLILVLDI